MNTNSILPLIPAPRRIRRDEGGFMLSPPTRIEIVSGATGAAGVREVAEYLRDLLHPPTGYSLPVTAVDPGAGITDGAIRLALSDGPGTAISQEGYRLRVTPAGVFLEGGGAAGLLHGVQTLRQLLSPEIESRERADEVVWQMPAVEIEDAPRFSWRGFMLDCSRHFMSPGCVKRVIEQCAALKLNRFHWHLTDDQGWRLEIRNHPELTRAGSRIAGGEGTAGFYSQDEIREIVAFAARRHVEVVPEIDLPGHSFAAMQSYPELCCTGAPQRSAGHQSDLYCAGREETFEFLCDVLDETIDLFPAPYIHLGGDEAPKERWKECPRCQERIVREGLKDEEELQGYFMRRLALHLRSKGRRAIGWDEMLDGGGLSDTIVQWWRHRQLGDAPAIEALRRGHELIASPNSFHYLNFPVEPDEHFSRERTSDVAKAYQAAYLPEGLSDAEKARVLGAECCLWTEFVRERDVDRWIFPRILPCAELMWSYPEKRDFREFYARVQTFEARLRHWNIELGPALSERNREKFECQEMAKFRSPSG